MVDSVELVKVEVAILLELLNEELVDSVRLKRVKIGVPVDSEDVELLVAAAEDEEEVSVSARIEVAIPQIVCVA